MRPDSVVSEDEGRPDDLVPAPPADLEALLGLDDVDGPWIARLGNPRGQVIGGIQDPGVAAFGREQQELADRYDAAVALGGQTLNVPNFVGEMNILSFDPSAINWRSVLHAAPASRGASKGPLRFAVSVFHGRLHGLEDRVTRVPMIARHASPAV